MPPRPIFRSQSRSRNTSSKWVPEAVRNYVLLMASRLYGSLMIFIAFAFVLIMISYDPSDLSWNTASTSGSINNWFGSFGSYAADIVWQLFGITGYLFAIILAAWGWRIASGNGLGLLLWRVVATLLASLACGAALATLYPLSTASASLTWGGAFGKILGDFVLHRLPLSWGKIVISASMFIIALGSLYTACALSLGEWNLLLKTFHGFTSWVAERIVHGLKHAWRHLRNNHDLTEDFLDEEDDKIEVKRLEDKKEATKPKMPTKQTKPAMVQRPAASARQARLPLNPEGSYVLPALDLLQWPDTPRNLHNDISESLLQKKAKKLESVLADFGVYGQVTKVSPGPVVTLYELEPSPGTRASRVISLADDIARNMSAVSVRVSIISGRNVIGIEMPNEKREIVYLRELLSTEAYSENTGLLPLVLGKDISGSPVIVDLSRMPHLLIAGTTGSGKSVAINTMILSLLYRLPPQICRFIMIDPKMLELSVYEGIPHLLAPVVTEPKKAIMALKWTAREMDERYRAMSKLGVRNIEGYNSRLREAAKNGESLTRTVQTGFNRENGRPIYEEQPLDLTPLPFIVVVVDEMADLMIMAGKDIESVVQRLSQKARAAGIHIIIATQRPSVDVITGTIKANLPSRISFQVTSKIDSRTILGEQGAEQLLGNGDMLYMAGGVRVTRVHGPFVRDSEVDAIVKFIKTQGEPEYLDEVTEDEEENNAGGDASGGDSSGSGNEMYDKAVDIVLRERKASISFIQRHLQIGYNRAATLVERMEREGIIGTANHVGKREVLGRKPDGD